ncbi:MAG: PilZ domain-containing protein [Gammaproteobacteria bacterium]|nr:PilZ domain-containing protein [Gammaproteobacteria bacterium]
MENRWSDRRELRLDVDVIRQGEKIFSCLSHDVGLGGAFINFATSRHVDKNAEVELVFHLMGNHQEVKHSLRARVVRITDNGIGLKFHEFDTCVFRSLQEIMSYKGVEKLH